MSMSHKTWKISYDPLDQYVEFEGVFRPSQDHEIDEVYRYLCSLHDSVQGILRLGFRRLRYINARGVSLLSRFVAFARDAGKLKLSIVASGVIAWNERVLPNLREVWNEIDFSVYDQNFYKSQGIIEDLDFVPLLRNQTRILWPLEKLVLQKHGLGRGMRVADICCGCGDVPLLISRELHPASVLGIDHSEASIEYARNLQSEFRIRNASFQRGDATALMVADDSFDFVSCRLSLQIFSQPELILKELIRICKPGGRVYTLCEDYDLIVGYPECDSIRHTYDRAAVYGSHMGMDLVSGKKLPGMLSHNHLEDVRTDQVVVDTSNTDREAFARVIESWRKFSVYTIGESLNLSQDDQDTLLAGYDAHLRTIRNPAGYSTWTMIACSGRKPAGDGGTTA